MTDQAQPHPDALRLRLETLSRYGLLNPSPDRAFDRVTALAAKLFAVPTALVSFVGQDRLHFRSCFGLGVSETSAVGSFCSAAIRQTGVLVVPDTQLDARFAAYPLVTGEPYLRFYAGAPLTTCDGVALGTLCILDTKPHLNFDTSLQQTLADLAAMVAETLETRRLSETLSRDRAFLQAVLENVADGIVACNAAGELTLFNETTRRLHGLPASPLGPDKLAEHYDLFQTDGVTPLAVRDIPLLRALEAGTVKNAELIIAPKNSAKKHHLTTSGRSFTDAQGNLLGAVVAMRDITAERAAEAALRDSETLHRTVLSALHEGVIRQEADGTISSHNPAAAHILGLTSEQLLGRTSHDPRWRIVREDGAPYPASERAPMRALQSGQPQLDDVYGVHQPDGTLKWISVNAQPLFQPGETKPYAVVSSFADVTERKHVEAQLLHTALHDPLTGLATRMLLKDRLDLAAARGQRSQRDTFALVFIDLDGFKAVNDTLGHVTGDEVLLRVAEVLKSCARKSDTVARFGGDEFAVLLEDLDDPKGAVKFAERVLSRLEFSLSSPGGDLNISASIGVAFPGAYPNAHALLEQADGAMYTAKQGGKAQISLASSLRN